MSEPVFARKIYLRRKEMNLSLRDIARASGVAASTISRIENGRLSPTLEIAAKLAVALSLEAPTSNQGPDTSRVDAEPAAGTQANTEEVFGPVVAYRQLERMILRQGVRRDLSKIAARNHYELVVLLRGTLELSTVAGFEENLSHGATINCKLIAQRTYFVTAMEEAELLWIG